MCSDGASSSGGRLAAAAVALAIVGATLRPPAESAGECRDPAARSSWQLLGGFRTIVASGFWLRTNLAWEKRDAAATRLWLELTVAADDEPLTYWFNGARMIAYDLPDWAVSSGTPEAVRRELRRDGARRALSFLARATTAHAHRAALYIEMANLRLRGLEDREGAARLLRVAAAQPDAPPYAARLRAELLRELGRPGEALACLREALPGLEPGRPDARREVVLQRIKALEAVLGAQ